jgi:hypothetical protein
MNPAHQSVASDAAQLSYMMRRNTGRRAARGRLIRIASVVTEGQ